MPTEKISEMSPAATPLVGTELLEVSQLSGGVYNTLNATSADVAYAGVSYGSFYDTTDQTGSTSAATAVKFGSNAINSHGVTVVTDGSALTRVTYAEAGTYMVAPNLQFKNTDTSNHNVTVWLRKNGADIANSATVINVPKTSDGGLSFFQIVFYETFTAGQYIQVMWLPDNVAVTIDYTAAGAIAPAIPSSILVTERINL